MIKLASFMNKLTRFITLVGGIVLGINVLFVIANILMRRLFNAPIYGSTEYVQYISLIAGALGLCQNEWYGGNVTMTIIQEKVSVKSARIMYFISSIISAIGFIYVSFLMTQDVFTKMQKGVVTNSLQMPKWIFVAVLAFGIIILTVAIIVKMIINGYAVFTGKTINLKDPESTGADEDALDASL